MPAATCLSLIDLKLSEFGLSLSADIVCIVTDGASVMVKLGSLTDTGTAAVLCPCCTAHRLGRVIPPT